MDRMDEQMMKVDGRQKLHFLEGIPQNRFILFEIILFNRLFHNFPFKLLQCSHIHIHLKSTVSDFILFQFIPKLK